MPDADNKGPAPVPLGPEETVSPVPADTAHRSTDLPGLPAVSGRVPMSSRELPPPERRSLKTEDLTGDKLILSAPRVLVEGKPTPSLGGIPLLAKLGQGGMGAVYYGVHPRLQKEVAVKVLPFHLAAQDPALIARFQREAQTSALVESPYLVRVLDVDEDGDLHYIVMEFVNGVSAGKYLKQVTAKDLIGLPEAAAMEICFATAKGLEEAHARGVVHRDVKPENILIPYAREAPGTEAAVRPQLDFAGSKLSDLGLARHQELTQPITIANATMGSPGFMAPEQIDDAHQAGPSSDLFALGATLYCLLAGCPPFRGGTAMQIMMKTATQPHTPLAAVRPDVSPVTLAIVNRCLEKKPGNRYADAREMLADIIRSRSSLPPSSEMPLRSPSTHVMEQTVALPRPADARSRAKSRSKIRRALTAAVVALAAVLVYVWMAGPPAGKPADLEPACEDAWRMTLSRARACGADLTRAEVAYAEFVSKFPLSDQAREASKRRAELGKRIESARQALVANLPTAYAAREKGRWSEVVEFLEEPLLNIGSQEHPSREKAETLLAEAKAELKRRTDFAAKVHEADQLMKLEACEEALKQYQAAQALWPGAGDDSVAAQGVRRAQEALVERKARKETDAGREALKARQWPQALARFEAALVLQAGNKDAREGRDEALFQTALAEGAQRAAQQPRPDWAGAQEAYARALKLRPEDADVRSRGALADAHASVEAAGSAADRREWRSVRQALQHLETDLASVGDPALRASVAALRKRADDEAAKIAAKENDAQEAGRLAQFDRAGRLYAELKELNPQNASAYDEALTGLQASQTFQTALAGADALRQGGDWAKARHAYRKLLEEKRLPAEAGVIQGRLSEVEAGEWIQKGRGALEQGALAEAQAALTSAEKILPARAQDLVVLLQTAQKNLAASMARADELERKARAARESGDLETARSSYTELGRLDASRRAACQQALGELEVRLKAQAEKAAQQQAIEGHLKEGQAAMARGDAAAALKEARAVLDVEPTHGEAKLLASQAEFALSFGQDAMGNFDAQRQHIGSLMQEGRYVEADAALKKCADEQARLRTLIESQPKNYLPEEVAGLKSATLECQTMASTLAPFVALEPQLKAVRARLDQAVERLKALPAAAGDARSEVTRARAAIDQALADSAKAFAERNYFAAQNATGTLAGKLKGLADNALTRAAGSLDEAAVRDTGNAAAYRAAAGELRGR
jgi:serine/threonine protein kinase